MANRIVLAGVLLTLPTMAVAQSSEPRLETGVFFTFAKLERIGSTDHGVGTSTAGLGGRIGWRLVRHVDVDGELSVHPRAGVSGYRIQGFAGARVGMSFGRLELYAKARPGFLYFEKDPFGVASPGSTFLRPEWADSLEPALDLGASIEYRTRRGLLVRFDVGETIVRYNSRTVVSSQLLPPMEVGGFTTRNRQWSMGVGRRF
jgi:hypothetical protein